MELLCLSDNLLVLVLALVVTASSLLYLFTTNHVHSTTPKPALLPPEPYGGLPIIGHLHQLLSSKKTLARALADMADSHGPIFTIRLGLLRAVVVSDPETVHECFAGGHLDRALASRPKSSNAECLTYNYAGLGAAPYGTYWRDIRKVAVTQLLSSHRLKSLRHVQISEIDMLIQSQSQSQSRGVAGISELLEQLACNTITRLIAGKRYFNYKGGGRGSEEGERIGGLIKEFMRICTDFVPSDFIPLLGWMNWFPGSLKSMKRVAAELDKVLQGWIEERKQLRNGTGGASGGEEQSAFIDVMLSAVGDDFAHHFSPDTIIKATSLTLILGGVDTTSITMTWIISNLLNNRRAMELAQQELDAKVGRNRVVEHSDIDSLVYLQAIVKETMRLYPAAPTGLPHQALEDCTIHGYHVPKGARVFANLWKLHRDPNVWHDPDEFKPERYLAEQVEDHENSAKNYELIPFGLGRRSCPGNAFALQVVHLTVARILQGFQISNATMVPVDMTEGLGLTMPKATPLEVKLAPRLPLYLYQVC
ncbi:unnamed protein product [Linum tenue]|uniref:Cytochrome P450 n=3 Tax=Linum tenue TaxID=586396 RepID=A0AAV0RU54_9ROSI|nr:unnamed protein product [Linum tenue]